LTQDERSRFIDGTSLFTFGSATLFTNLLTLLQNLLINDGFAHNALSKYVTIQDLIKP
jgi:hypothetical protein